MPFLTDKYRDRCYTRAGPEIGSDQGKLVLITCAMYRFKTSSSSFRSHLAETLYELGYTPTKTDPDVWLRKAVKADGFQYYEIVLCYVDDVLCI